MSDPSSHVRCPPPQPRAKKSALVEQVKRYFDSRDKLRRGLCLLNAGCHQEAVKTITEATRLNPDSLTLTEQLVRAYVGCEDYQAAADQVSKIIAKDPDDITPRIRHAMLLFKSGDKKGAIGSLRESIATHRDCAELHYQLGNLLAELGEEEEAEMRFTLAVDLDPRHADAMVNVAMCHAAREQPDRALRFLLRAQTLRPHDARIALLLGMATRAADHKVFRFDGMLNMPSHSATDDRHATQALTGIIERDPEFVDAFTGLPADEVDRDVFEVLCETLSRAVERHPDDADLHFQHGAVLERLGRSDEALAASEQAVTFDPDHVRALIQLATLHRKRENIDEAIRCLEQVVRLGIRFADVFVALGTLYRQNDRIDQARNAFAQALEINQDYQEARLALEDLPD